MSALSDARAHLAKARSQYQTVDIARTDAVKAVEWARKLLDGAAVIVAE
ncbi:MAG TPA: hypothetical protein PLP95_05520 [Microthrixaceae bacterium]|nr:hypothetical protein [Microthrixaceae bacterium]